VNPRKSCIHFFQSSKKFQKLIDNVRVSGGKAMTNKCFDRIHDGKSLLEHPLQLIAHDTL
jgi:hypothetical protein